MTIKYFHLNHAPFISKDIEILKSKYVLKSKLINLSGKFSFIKGLFSQLIFTCQNLNQNIIFITQFAGYQSVIPTYIGKQLNIKNFIILGGTDCNWLPSISYGNYNKKLLRWATEYSLKNAYHLIPVNKELVECDYSYTDTDFVKQGYKSFIKNIKTPYTVIPNGIDISLYNISIQSPMQASFITICSVLEDDKRRLVKGIDMILKIAKIRSDIKITIIGGAFPPHTEIPSNVTTFPFISNDQLPDLFRQHQFYLQLSMTEGFPNAVIEAMACGCIPIVSAVGAMPEIVDGVGYVLPKKNIQLFENLIQKALIEYNQSKKYEANAKAKTYDIKFRSKMLLALIEQHTKK